MEERRAEVGLNFHRISSLIFFALLCVSGCGQKPRTSPPEKTKSDVAGKKEKTEPSKSSLSDLVPKPSTNAKKDSPEAVFEAFKDAMAAGEYEKVYDLLVKREQAKLDENAKKFKATVDKNTPHPTQMARLQKFGLKKEQVMNPAGRDMLRLSLALVAMLMESSQEQKGEKKDGMSVIKEMQEATKKVKLLNVKMALDKKTALLRVIDSKANKKDIKLEKEGNQWKLTSLTTFEPAPAKK